MICGAGKLEAIFVMIRQIESYLPVKAAYVTAILKMVGIAYVGQFSAGLCRDAGYSSVAGQIELFCRVSHPADQHACSWLFWKRCRDSWDETGDFGAASVSGALKVKGIPVWGQEETEELAGDLQEEILRTGKK